MAGVPVVYAAARNNAEWCDAFCRTYGIAGRLEAEFWTSPKRTPPLYPDAVTLAPGIAPAQFLAGIDTSDGCSVKDSFADLDLTPHSFRVLFRASGCSGPETLRLRRAGGWSSRRESNSKSGSRRGARRLRLPPFFRPALLANAAIAVLARYDGDRIAAGAVANRSATVVGLSNVFDTDGDLASAWRDAGRAAQARWGSVPVVSYDSGAALEAAHQAGFGSVGELAVWVRS
jgi:hypothetical protein